jgi:murein DD-endopeptidase MepM/ murein hydrolase activator NlpD
LILGASAVGAGSKSSQHRLSVRPVKGPIISMFGFRPNPMSKTGKKHFHEGVDMHAVEGEPVLAAEIGVVIEARHIGGYGNVVYVVHPDGLETRYAHLQKIEVIKGQLVVGGDQIGQAGSTGMSLGPHLHFEVREDGFVVDPYDEMPARGKKRVKKPNT